MGKRKYWLISDTHFHHENILKFTGDDGRLIRGSGFSDVDEMDEYMVQMWNEAVRPGDYVYHLGDVFMGSRDKFRKLWPRLNGSKRLAVGNHDDPRFLCAGGFFRKSFAFKKWKEVELVLSHAPMHPNIFSEKVRFNVHGHIHEKALDDPRYLNVSVERTDYRPLELDEVLEKLRRGN